MTGIKAPQDFTALVNRAVRGNGVENIGLDLRGIGAGGKEEKIKRIAVQFEEMLINTMLKDAFKEEQPQDEDGGLPLTAGSGSYQSMRTMFLSQYLADNGGLGYREVIERQLMDMYKTTQGETPGVTTPAGPLDLAGARTVPAAPTLRRKPETTDALTNLPTNKQPVAAVTAPLVVSRPVAGRVSSDYGWRKDPIDGKTRFHAGIDFEVPPHTPVKSVMEGVVTFSGWKKGYGHFVEVRHPDGSSSRYGHNAELTVKEGDRVASGTVIALSGSSGRSTGPHLHFEMRRGAFSVDPAKILASAGRELLAKK